MDFVERIRKGLSWADPRVLGFVESALRHIPAVQRRIDAETDAVLDGLEPSLKPYREELPAQLSLPGKGVERDALLQRMTALRDREEGKWKSGRVSGAVYHGDEAHIDFLNRVYALHSQANPLHPDVWPSVNRYEAEVVAMTARMLGGGHVVAEAGDAGVCGTVTSGGTESILLAMKTYRDQARTERGIREPEMVTPTTAHAAFDKAAQYFGLRHIKVPVGPDFRADVKATRKVVGANTAVVVGSAPSFPHGVIDPIEELSELARQRGAGFHTDACLGGFVLPWAKRLGAPVPAFDFGLPGVTSMSCDTHKYGYAAKGTSVVLYRSERLRRHQFFAATDWPGGLYLSPTMAGSRPGALIAACWAAMMAMGEEGYLEATRRILSAAEKVKAGIRGIDGLELYGDALFVIAFGGRNGLDVFRVLDAMSHRGWSLNGLHMPSAVHLCVTLRHTQEGVVERFLEDLRASVEEVKGTPGGTGGMAPAYGMAASLPLRGVVADLLKKYLDRLYRV